MLMNCVAYQDGKKLADLKIQQISESICDPKTFVWVAIKDPERSELDLLQEEFGLHELAIEDARHGHQRPKFEEYADSLFIVLHTVEIGSNNNLEVGEVEIFVGKNYILTIRHRSSQGFSTVRQRCEQEPTHLKENGPGFVLYALMDIIVDRYVPIMNFIESELERIEEQIFSRVGSTRGNIEALYALKQKLIVLQHATGPLLEVIGKLHGGRVPQICYGLQEYFRDIDDHTVRINRSIESCREMTTTAIQVNLSFIALNESEVSKKLAAYAALFAVPTSLAGIYGMNFKYMPGLESKLGYPIVLCTILIIDILLWIRFRKVGWI
jgi:magnesium transporter